MHCCIQKERRQAAVEQVGRGEAIFSITGNKIRRVGREEDFSNLTDHIFAGGQTEHIYDTKTQRQREQEEKDSSTRPLLLGPLGARGRASPFRNPADEVAHWVTPLFHLQPDSLEDGHMDKDRQTE